MGQERLVAVIAARPRAVAMERRLCSLAGFGGRDSFGWVDVVSGVISRAEWGVLLGWSAVLLGARKYSGVWLYLCQSMGIPYDQKKTFTSAGLVSKALKVSEGI
jgi:hypothetical protein